MSTSQPKTPNTSSELGMLHRVKIALKLGLFSLGHFNLFKIMFELLQIEHNLSFRHLLNLATLESEIVNFPSSKIKFFSHCSHDTVEGLISAADHVVDMHTDHSLNLSTLSKNKHALVERTTRKTMLDERFSEPVPPFLWCIYQSIQRRPQSQHCIVIHIKYLLHIVWWCNKDVSHIFIST